MSQGAIDMIGFTRPDNSREIVLRRKDLLLLNMRLLLPFLLINVCYAFECIVFSIIYLYSPHEFLYYEVNEYVVIVFIVLFFYYFWNAMLSYNQD
jgi:hypothetical protein